MRMKRVEARGIFYAFAFAAAFADSIVLNMSIEIVIGPTPPGTGVIKLAFSLTASKSTSPASL